jgi:site-specific recombinase XerD
VVRSRQLEVLVARLSVVSLREARQPEAPEGLEDLETDLLAGFVLARASAGMADVTIRHDVMYLEQIRTWLQRPLWTMQPEDADRFFGEALRSAAPNTKSAKASALALFFRYLELRHKVEIYHRTGYAVECPLDELNRPPGGSQVLIRVPPSEQEMSALFGGWRGELATCRKYATAARNFTAARLMSLVGLRINELIRLDLADVRWELGAFGQIHVRYGKGSRGRGPKVRLVPLINQARPLLQWYVEDVWGRFGLDPDLPDAPLFPSERRPSGGNGRANDDTLRAALKEVTTRHLPTWRGRLTPHVLRHYCASQLYLTGMDLVAVQELLGHEWVCTTMRYVHVHRDHVASAWLAGQARAASRLEGFPVTGHDQGERA